MRKFYNSYEIADAIAARFNQRFEGKYARVRTDFATFMGRIFIEVSSDIDR